MNTHIRKDTCINQPDFQEKVYTDGYAMAGHLDQSKLDELKALYEAKHKISKQGMFYSVYSKDHEYRQEIYTRINEILQPVLSSMFNQFRIQFSIFIIKASGKQTDFKVHMDPTRIDESKYTPVQLWIPLVDVADDTGVMCIMDKSHHFYNPYRSVSVPSPFGKVHREVRNYMHTITMKAGELLLFDPRLLHCSLPNTSEVIRPSVVVGIVPVDSSNLIVHMEPHATDEIEIYSQNDEFYQMSDSFYWSCRCRPDTGVMSEVMKVDIQQHTPLSFKAACDELGIEERNELPPMEDSECVMYSEPIQSQDPYKYNWLERKLSLIKDKIEDRR